jgi:hypothetical protein
MKALRRRTVVVGCLAAVDAGVRVPPNDQSRIRRFSVLYPLTSVPGFVIFM